MYNLSSYPMLATIVTTLMLSIIFLILSRQSRKMYMQIWGCSWLVCSVIFILDFSNLTLYMDNMAYIMLRQLFALIASFLFLMGTYRFFQLRMPTYFGAATLISAITILLYPASEKMYSLFLIPNIILCSGMLVISGCLFITVSWTQKIPEKLCAGFLIIGWSIFINHFGFTLKNSSLAVITYFIGLFTVNILMMILIIMYFKKLRFIDDRLSSRFRLLVENSSDMMFLYDYRKQRFEYISPTINELVGLPAQSLYDAPERFFERVSIEEKNSEIIKIFSRPVPTSGDGVLCLYESGEVSKWAEIHYIPIRDNADIVTAVEGILRDITEQRIIEKELEDAAQAKQELLENISHEIKTPITLITGYSETLINKLIPEEATDTYLKMINSKAMMLSTLVDDLSHVSDLSSQTMEYKFYEKNAAEVFDELIKQAEVHITSSGHEAIIHSDIDEKAILIIDPYRIQQVITNLINNAIRHTPPRNTISISCFTKPSGSFSHQDDFGHDIPDGELIFVVSDTGEGISEHDLPFVFDRHFSSRRKPDGRSGLGLHISQQIVSQHSGKIFAKNNKYGGARITFTLPYYS